MASITSATIPYVISAIQQTPLGAGGLGLAFVSGASAVGTSIFTTKLSETLRKNVTDPQAIFRNHHLHALVGTAVSRVVLRHSERALLPSNQNALECLAGKFCEEWNNLCEKSWFQESAEEVTSEELRNWFSFELENASCHTSLTPDMWATILKAASKRHQCNADQKSIVELGEILHNELPLVVRELLLEDAAKGGKAFNGLVLRILAEIHGAVHQTMKEGFLEANAERTQILSTLHALVDYSKEVEYRDENLAILVEKGFKQLADLLEDLIQSKVSGDELQLLVDQLEVHEITPDLSLNDFDRQEIDKFKCPKRSEMFRVELEHRSEGDRNFLGVNIGFFETGITNNLGESIPVSIGCEKATSEMRLDTHKSTSEPIIVFANEPIEFVSEFGIGSKPRFQCRTRIPDSILEGRISLSYAIVKLKNVEDQPKRRARITMKPKRYRIVGHEEELSPEVRVLLASFLRALEQKRSMSAGIDIHD